MFNSKRRNFPGGHGSKVNCYVRDIICLPEEWRGDQHKISIPRKKKLNFLAVSGLLGKIEFSSVMSEDEVSKEICRVFAGIMGLTHEMIEEGHRFPYTYLQKAGAGSRALCAPSVSSSFEWTGKQVSTLAKSGGTIYIIANEKLPKISEVSLH